MNDFIKEDSVVLMCAPAGPRQLEIPGTETMTATCGHEISIAPSGRKVLADAVGKGVTICIPCVLGDARCRDMLKGHKAAVTPDQHRELSEKIGVGEMDQLMAKLHLSEREV